MAVRVLEIGGLGGHPFVEDGALDVYAPLSQLRDTSALEAVHCGLEMLRARESLCDYAQEHFNFELRIGIGIDHGKAIVGEMGYYRNMQFNVIGDVVNTASRVQDLTKETGATLLVTNAVYERLRDRFETGQELETAIRGKTGLHKVFEVVGPK